MDRNNLVHFPFRYIWDHYAFTEELAHFLKTQKDLDTQNMVAVLSIVKE